MPSHRFPFDSVVKDLPANARVTGSVPDLGGCRLLQGTETVHHSSRACALEATCRNCRTRELQLPKPTSPTTRALQRERAHDEKPVRHNCRLAPTHCSYREAHEAAKAHRKPATLVTWTSALSKSNYEPRRVGPPRWMGHGETKCGQLEKGTANHFNILTLRTP